MCAIGRGKRSHVGCLLLIQVDGLFNHAWAVLLLQFICIYLGIIFQIAHVLLPFARAGSGFLAAGARQQDVLHHR